mmetsp:Transcript_52592/g.138767  ORF Transcript_52592/g.138767 Transcript_52592/m.138767 type:complete len:225 (+) Transcript_52592:629-1303(+)
MSELLAPYPGSLQQPSEFRHHRERHRAPHTSPSPCGESVLHGVYPWLGGVALRHRGPDRSHLHRALRDGRPGHRGPDAHPGRDLPFPELPVLQQAGARGHHLDPASVKVGVPRHVRVHAPCASDPQPGPRPAHPDRRPPGHRFRLLLRLLRVRHRLFVGVPPAQGAKGGERGRQSGEERRREAAACVGVHRHAGRVLLGPRARRGVRLAHVFWVPDPVHGPSNQ